MLSHVSGLCGMGKALDLGSASHFAVNLMYTGPCLSFFSRPVPSGKGQL
jgi:hypothetical protein